MCAGLSLGRSTPRIRGMDSTPRLALALLVARVGANDKQATAAAHQLAILADTFDAGPNLHGEPFQSNRQVKKFVNRNCSNSARPRQAIRTRWAAGPAKAGTTSM